MCPKSPEQNEEVRKQSLQNILDAAFVLMAKQGYESTSISQIAKHAGVSKGLLYNYFSSKEEMLITLVDNTMNEGDSLLSELDFGDPKGALRAILNWYFDELIEKPDHWKLITELTFKIEKFDFVQQIFITKLNEYVALLEQLLSNIGFDNPNEEARLMVSLFDGIGIHYLVMRDGYPIEKMREFLILKYCG